jgi:Domain of unknown function (DUF5617)
MKKVLIVYRQEWVAEAQHYARKYCDDFSSPVFAVDCVFCDQQEIDNFFANLKLFLERDFEVHLIRSLPDGGNVFGGEGSYSDSFIEVFQHHKNNTFLGFVGDEPISDPSVLLDKKFNDPTNNLSKAFLKEHISYSSLVEICTSYPINSTRRLVLLKKFYTTGQSALSLELDKYRDLTARQTKILQQLQGTWSKNAEHAPLDKAKLLLQDYTKSNSRIMRIFTGCWNRHHIAEVTAIQKDVSIATVEQLLEKLGNIKLKNSEGHLATIIRFLATEVIYPNPLQENQVPRATLEGK